MKGYILSFMEKGDLRITKNYSGKTLIDMTAKAYDTPLCNCIQPEVEKILWKNQNNF